MTPRHPLDGNAIAADQHYDQPHPSDHDFCDQCGATFREPNADDRTVEQHRVMFVLCESCGDNMEDER